MRQVVIVASLSVAMCALAIVACERGPRPDWGDDDAGVDAEVEESGVRAEAVVPDGGCYASVSTDRGGPPAILPEQTFQVQGISCVHPPVLANCSEGWCTIPPGCFVMGSVSTEWGRGAYSEDEVAVRLTHGFVIHQTETTRSDWSALGFELESGSRYDSDGGVLGTECVEPSCPAASVTWWEAVAFANALSDREGRQRCYELSGCSGTMGHGFACTSVEQPMSFYECNGYRLPLEVEWEYAARAGTRTTYYSGEITPQPYFTTCCRENSLERASWYCGNSGRITHPVGQKMANGWGLFDILGNVREWVNDPYTGSSEPEPLTDPYGFLSKKNKAVVRGGSALDPPSYLRASAGALDYRREWKFIGHGVGFRLVRTLP